MQSLRRHHPCSPAAPPLDDDNLLSEILLRLPPQPSSLPRASAVCKRWRLLVSDPGFSRRFRIHHRRNPPLLGIFDERSGEISFLPTLDAPNRIPPGCLSLKFDGGDRFLPLGCRHGLVLVFHFNESWKQILVCDPATADQHRIALPPGLATLMEKTPFNGAVLRAAGETHFRVVLTVADNDNKQHLRALAWVYSSGTGLWGDVISAPVPPEVPMSEYSTLVFIARQHAVLVGDSLYWRLVGDFYGILEFDMKKQSLAVIRVPVHILEEGHYIFLIVRAEGGGLGLILWTGCNIQLWKRKNDCDGGASWVLGRTIELDKLLFLNSEEDDIKILGFAEENNVLLLWTGGALFMVHLESLQFKRVFESVHIPHCQPFESVYTAGI
ncbi:uncharacterized protein LOC119325946 [Triticum dicoccoides]|uniref:uncharacterized protein LOC119325946 n=1 Tax=Triticum dicoccoides TaxID=85692 RepID=UPI001891E030|nr:uncharacterized protein LOC119325946 [Triticum dicoccoides]